MTVKELKHTTYVLFININKSDRHLYLLVKYNELVMLTFLLIIKQIVPASSHYLVYIVGLL